MVSNLTYIIPSDEPALTVTLNAPVMWWYLSTTVEHGKDEVLRLFSSFMEQAPITPAVLCDDLCADIAQVQKGVAEIKLAIANICDWLGHEFGIRKSARAHDSAHLGDADAFVTAVRAGEGAAYGCGDGDAEVGRRARRSAVCVLCLFQQSRVLA